MSVADSSSPDPFDDAFADNLVLVLEMLDCMRSESEFAGRQDKAEFLTGVGKALATFARFKIAAEQFYSQPERPVEPSHWKR